MSDENQAERPDYGEVGFEVEGWPCSQILGQEEYDKINLGDLAEVEGCWADDPEAESGRRFYLLTFASGDFGYFLSYSALDQSATREPSIEAEVTILSKKLLQDA
jgi:hypothetical protein